MSGNNQEKMPVFLINGFLEAGKTQFISFTLQQEYFQADGVTVLILCEEGDTEYDQELLKKTRTKVITVDSADELDEDFFGRLEALYDPDRVLIEWNGIWPQDQLKLPADWELFQQITIIDGSTFELYLNNMKPLLGLMVRNSELIIMNRCDDLTDDSLTRYRRGLKALNPQADLILEDAEGEIEQELLEEDLFEQMVQELKKTYDYVIIDTPPMANLIDGAIVARQCDGAVMVVESGCISYRLEQRVKGQLEKSGCRILGVVLNKVSMERNGYYSKYYSRYGKYGKYSKYGKYGKYGKYEKYEKAEA